jgi:hypothetical protein
VPEKVVLAKARKLIRQGLLRRYANATQASMIAQQVINRSVG